MCERHQKRHRRRGIHDPEWIFQLEILVLILRLSRQLVLAVSFGLTPVVPNFLQISVIPPRTNSYHRDLFLKSICSGD